MGLLVDGVWQDKWYDTRSTGGRFERQASRFRDWVTPDGSAGPTGEAGFPAEPNRYHLYISLACPWAHRTLIFRSLKQLQDVIGVSVVSPLMGKKGWTFEESEGSSGDALEGTSTLADIYQKVDPQITTRVTVPVLWDKQRRSIVNNESADIIRMLNSAFDAFTSVQTDYYPPALQEEIDRINKLIYDSVNNGVYRAGFATRQNAYEDAANALFRTLDDLELRLAAQRYLVGDALTEADWRLFTTLVRFDAVYHGHFKCNLRRIVDYPNLWDYVRDLYQTPGVAGTVSLDHIKRHYYASHLNINPTGIIPIGPDIDFDAPHQRHRLGAA